MGLRTASVRRPHAATAAAGVAAVMAPALTDAAQPTSSGKLQALLASLSPITSPDAAGTMPATHAEEPPAEQADMDHLLSSLLLSMDEQDEHDQQQTQQQAQQQQRLELHSRLSSSERRLDFLKRRVHKLQARHMGQHTSQEICGVYEYVHRQLKRLHADTTAECPKPANKPMSTASSKSLLRKLETTANLQANTASRQRFNAQRYFGSASVEAPAFRANVASMLTIPPWPVEVKKELGNVTGLLKAELDLVQRQVDSEATESSSGGESCDEFQSYTNPHQQYLSIQKRALWKYSTERAAIAARWTWLQAQISDLEYRIRQHTDLHKQIRTGKGAVVLGGANPPPIPPQECPSSAAVNGYRGPLPGAQEPQLQQQPSDALPQSQADSEPPAADWEYQCARTRPLLEIKRRKLLQTAGLHAVSKKAARPSTLRCGCVPVNVPCALCTGRTDPTHPRDAPEALSKAERIALLDTAYHPVFSLPEDTSQSIHLEAIMKTSEWQQRSTRMKTPKLLNRAEKDKSHTANSSEHRSKKLEHRAKKYNRHLKPSTMTALSAKLKNKMRERKTSTGRNSSLHKLSRRKHSSSKMHSIGSDIGLDDDELEALGGNVRSSLESPSSSPLLHMQSISGYNKKNRIDSYDIDNIVIPYSVAASTRVEKLQYKEILTPKWRLAESEFVKAEPKNNGAVVTRKPSQEEDNEEDMSEEAVIQRHERCEHAERKKFLSYLPIGYGRPRSHKRMDSGANTPDPMSPAQPTEASSPIGSPPATPLAQPLTDDPASLPPLSTTNSGNMLMRRRTISQSKLSLLVHAGNNREYTKPEDCPPIAEFPEVAPYEPRLFPLPEDVYERMLKNMPEDHQFATNARSQEEEFVALLLDDEEVEQKADSPGSESTESALGDEDPNDPEWVDMERVRDRHKR